jgi:hypothetical protein
MLLEVYEGESVRLTAKDLTHISEGSVTTGADVVITLYDLNGDEISHSTAIVAGASDDWYADFAAPGTPGEYEFKIVAQKSGATWKGKDSIRVKAF